MRVLFWSEFFWPYIGGAELIGAKLISAMRERGYEFAVITRKDSPDLPSKDRYNGIEIYRYPFWEAMRSLGTDQLMHVRRQVADLKRSFAPDVVHLNGFGPTSLFFHLETKKAHPAPWLVAMHQGIGGRALELSSLGSADWVVGCSRATLDTARSRIPKIISRSSVIYNGIEEPSLFPSSLPFDAPRLLCVGRLDTQKGYDLALTAFASIIDRYPRVRLVLAGDGPERPALEKQAKELGIIHAVDFNGWVAPEMVPDLINASTIVMMPSRRESFGLVAVEAALMARPTVATRVGGLPEVVVDGETGIVVEPEDPAALADATVHLLTHRKTATEMGLAGRRRAREVFGLQQYVDAYDDLYQKMVKHPFLRNKLELSRLRT
ncbi:MAG: glycosyltransferase family 4 protein [Deltaproteobacteria bacterium]|nr:glycosyltransferase family 4 protein [Deltaproteobacteria bacterium]MBW2283385.1 glycosyltransferase family 4 protein [Deltaproteobacteria bacterium]